MIQIRKQWFFLVLGIAGAGYLANNYRIAGLGNLRVEPRAASSDGSAMASAQPSWGENMFGLSTAISRGGSVAPGLSSSTGIPPWDSKLTSGEKYALWDHSRSNSSNSMGIPGLTSPPSTFSPQSENSDFNLNLPVSGNLFLPPTVAGSIPRSSSSASGGEVAVGAIPPGNMVIPPGNMVQNNPRVAAGNGGFPAATERIRVASFNLEVLGPEKIAKPHVLELTARILREFEVVALQGLQSSRDDVMPTLVERLNLQGRKYDYLVGPRVGRDGPREQFAFVFDTSKIETDRFQLYTVDDPEELMTYDPLVAWFRCKNLPTNQAFTFSLVNVHIPPRAAQAEQSILPNLITAVEQDGRGEDDCILLGDFAGSTYELSMLQRDSIRFALENVPTDVAGQRMLDSIMFSARGTIEFTGRSGAYDFLRKYNLSLESAMEISQHLPIWAEFSSLEGGDLGRAFPPTARDVL